MWTPAGYYADHYDSGFDSYAYPSEYDEGYGEEEECVGEEAGDYGAPQPTAPRCWSGSACPFFARGTCQYYHPTEDREEERIVHQDRDEETPSSACHGAFSPSCAVDARPCARPWNVLVNPASAAGKKGEPIAPVPQRAELQEKVEPRARSRSPHRKDLVLEKAKTYLAELREKIEVQNLGQMSSASMAALRGA